jgi:hypothetical protein
MGVGFQEKHSRSFEFAVRAESECGAELVIQAVCAMLTAVWADQCLSTVA